MLFINGESGICMPDSFAWENIPGGAYQNAEFLTAYEARGQIVTVTPASAMNVHVTVIPSTR